MEWKKATNVEKNTFSIPDSWVYLQYYEAFNLLFRIENALRVFVYLVLKNEFNEKWAEIQVTSEDENEGTIASIAKRRMGQSKSFGYLGHSINCPIMHLTSGELTRLIYSETYWKHFNGFFLGSKEIMKNKLEEIGSIRNSLAHFRPIKHDDVDVLKQNSKHVLLGIEKFLKQALIQPDVVPTNTSEKWYEELKTLGTEQCTFYFFQSKDEQWIKLNMAYECPLIKDQVYLDTYISYTVLTIKSTAILNSHHNVSKNISYMSESIPNITMPDDFKPRFVKNIDLVFSKKLLTQNTKNIKSDLEQLLLCISKETELIEQDNLARGDLIHSVVTHATAATKDDKVTWTVNKYPLLTPDTETDPTEYWGDLHFFGWQDIISETQRYPWMPEIISKFQY